MSAKQATTANTNPMSQLGLAFEPLFEAARAWTTESARIQQTTFEGLAKALDGGHKLAQESLDMAVGFNASLQRQANAQLERLGELMASFSA